MSRLQYTFSEALRNMARTPLVVLGAVLAVFISLFLTFGSLVVGEVVRINTLKWSADVRVEAFLDDDFRDVDELQATIAGWEEVDQVFYLSKAEAFEFAKDIFRNDPVTLEILEEDPSIVPASFRIRPVDLEQYDIIAARLEGTPGVTDVLSAAEAVNRIDDVRSSLGIFFGLLTIALGAAALAVIANTIHMAIYARREEIEIMKLVGASNWFVRTPFVLEGMMEGLLGGLLAVAVGAAIYQPFRRLQGLPDYISVEVGNPFLLRWSLVVLAFGVIVGAAGSAISLSVHRYIRA